MWPQTGIRTTMSYDKENRLAVHKSGSTVNTITAADIVGLACTSMTIPIPIGHPAVDSPKALVTEHSHPRRLKAKLQIKTVPNYEP